MYGFVLLAALFMIVSTTVVFARNASAESTCGDVKTFFDWSCKSGENGIDTLLSDVMGWLAGGVGIAVMGGIIYGAILYTSAGGNAAQTTKGLKAIRNSAIALLLFFGAGNIIGYLAGGSNLSKVPAAQGFTTLLGQKGILDGVDFSSGGSIIIPISRLITNVMNLATFVVGMLAVLFVIWGGFQYLTSAGDSGKAAKGSQTITRSVIGLIIAIVGNVVVKIVETATGKTIATSGDIAPGSLGNWTISLSSILNQVYLIAGIIAVIMIIYAGIQYILSAGDAGKAKTSRQNITYSLIGIVVIILAYAITNFVTTNVAAPTDVASLAANITNIAFFAIGILAVIMIIISGLRYITSAGDAGKAKSSRQMLTNSLIGIVIAVLAYAIVSFVIEKLGA